MKILFVTGTRIGDALLSTGILHRLIDGRNDARVTIACGAPAAPLFEAVPGLERLIVLEKRRWSLHWLDLWAHAVWRFWDWVIDLRNAPLTYLIPARRSRHVGRDDRKDHRVRYFARMLGWAEDPPAPQLWLNDAHLARAHALLPGDGPVLALGPTANWAPKIWHPERFADLAERLTAADGILPGARIAVFGHATERALADPVINRLPSERTIDLVGRASLLEGAACLRRCNFYVGNDSGLTHLAAAAGTPTLALFGPTPKHLFAPWGDHCAVADTGMYYQAHFVTGEEWLSDRSLLDPLRVTDAETAAWSLWQRLHGGRADPAEAAGEAGT